MNQSRLQLKKGIGSWIDRLVKDQTPLSVVVCTVQFDAKQPAFGLHVAGAGSTPSTPTLDHYAVHWAREETSLKAGDK